MSIVSEESDDPCDEISRGVEVDPLGDETEDETGAAPARSQGPRAPPEPEGLPPARVSRAEPAPAASFEVRLPSGEFPDLARLGPAEASAAVAQHLRIARAVVACSRVSFATDEVREVLARVSQEARAAQARQVAESEASAQHVRRAAQGISEALEAGLREVRRAQEGLVGVVRDAVVASAPRAGPEAAAMGAAVAELRALSEGLQRTLASLSLTSASSSARGRLAEAAVETYFRERLLPGDEIESVASTAESCDLVVRRGRGRGGIVAIEVKSYTGTVPSAQYEKFLRDMGRYPREAVGLFVSLGQAIAHRPAFALEGDPDGRALLVVPNADLAFAWAAFRVACVILDERARIAEAAASRDERDREYERFRAASGAVAEAVRGLLSRAQGVVRAATLAEDSLRELRAQAESMCDGVVEAAQGAFRAAGLETEALPAPPNPPPGKRRRALK